MESVETKVSQTSDPKLSWEETAKAMAAAGEDWSEWDSVVGDGIDGL
jgi:hypothetical protein